MNRGWLALVGLLATGPAAAACPEPVMLDTLLSRTIAIDEALAADQNLTARDGARRLRDELRCLSELVDRATAAQIARGIAAGYVATGEMALGKPWLRTAIDLDGAYVWTLPDDHPVMEVWRTLSAEPVPDPERLTDESFAGAAYLDGEPIDEPAATPGRPHLFQLDGTPVQTWIVIGGRFPAEALGSLSGRSRRASRDRTRDDEAERRFGEPLMVDRVRPPEKTPLLVGGAALVVAAGGLYGLAAQRRARFDDVTFARTEGEVRRLRTQVNGLVIGSAAVFAVGAGGIAWGSLVDARGTATLRLRF